MSEVFSYASGDAPLLISVPHDGREIPASILARMTQAGQSRADTDWHVGKLYEFARGLGAHVLIANFSRYVVDLNRPVDDEVLYPGKIATGLCPEKTFAGDRLYTQGGADDAERKDRVATYWQPYHEKITTTLASIRERFGYALLWDAHSIPSTVPRLFDGELPLLNLGSNDGESCARAIEDDVVAVMRLKCDSSVLNGRFKGGYITRHFGNPANNLYALQLEIAQRAYMDERTLLFDADKAANLRATLLPMIDAFLKSAQKQHRVQ